jgi:hypothetical protein
MRKGMEKNGKNHKKDKSRNEVEKQGNDAMEKEVE